MNKNIKACYDFVPPPPSINYGENVVNGEDNDFSPKKEDMKKVDMILGINGKAKTYPCEFYSDPFDDGNGVTRNDEGYRVYIPKYDYKKSGLDYIKMKITYSNGFVDTKDITNEIETEFIN
ncbi:hypothetical protein [Romboutsia sp.]|uniref:hypothetical protein n=1 Tax=Romboutsia sp. TaxID=1965302 RepID=UPI003F39A084